MAGSGKTEAKNFFADKGFVPLKFGVTEHTIEKYGKTTEELERMERNHLREEHGMGVFAAMAVEKIRGLLEKGENVVIENMYSWSEYKVLKENFGDQFVTIAILASPAIRYVRLAERAQKDGRLSYRDPEVSRSRDHSEIEEIEKGGPIAMADHYVINEDSLSGLHKSLQQIYKNFQL